MKTGESEQTSPISLESDHEYILTLFQTPFSSLHRLFQIYNFLSRPHSTSSSQRLAQKQSQPVIPREIPTSNTHNTINIENNTDQPDLPDEQRLRLNTNWETLKELYKKNATINGIIINEVTNGFIVKVMDIQAFLPRTLVDTSSIPGYPNINGQSLAFKIIKMNDHPKSIIISCRAIIESQYPWENFFVHQKHKNLASIGRELIELKKGFDPLEAIRKKVKELEKEKDIFLLQNEASIDREKVQVNKYLEQIDEATAKAKTLQIVNNEKSLSESQQAWQTVERLEREFACKRNIILKRIQAFESSRKEETLRLDEQLEKARLDVEQTTTTHNKYRISIYQYILSFFPAILTLCSNENAEIRKLRQIDPSFLTDEEYTSISAIFDEFKAQLHDDVRHLTHFWPATCTEYSDCLEVIQSTERFIYYYERLMNNGAKDSPLTDMLKLHIFSNAPFNSYYELNLSLSNSFEKDKFLFSLKDPHIFSLKNFLELCDNAPFAACMLYQQSRFVRNLCKGNETRFIRLLIEKFYADTETKEEQAKQIKLTLKRIISNKGKTTEDLILMFFSAFFAKLSKSLQKSAATVVKAQDFAYYKTEEGYYGMPVLAALQRRAWQMNLLAPTPLSLSVFSKTIMQIVEEIHVIEENQKDTLQRKVPTISSSTQYFLSLNINDFLNETKRKFIQDFNDTGAFCCSVLYILLSKIEKIQLGMKLTSLETSDQNITQAYLFFQLTLLFHQIYPTLHLPTTFQFNNVLNTITGKRNKKPPSDFSSLLVTFFPNIKQGLTTEVHSKALVSLPNHLQSLLTPFGFNI